MSEAGPATSCCWPCRTSRARPWRAAATGSICNSAADDFPVGRAIGGRSVRDTRAADMITLAKAVTATCLLPLLCVAAAQAQDLGVRPLRYGHTSTWYYDNRDDDRDMPTNGFFPGNFTADPSTAWLGAAGVLAGNSYRSPLPYPSQVVIGPSPYQNSCAQRYRSYDRASGTYVGRGGLRHRC